MKTNEVSCWQQWFAENERVFPQSRVKLYVGEAGSAYAVRLEEVELICDGCK